MAYGAKFERRLRRLNLGLILVGDNGEGSSNALCPQGDWSGSENFPVNPIGTLFGRWRGGMRNRIIRIRVSAHEAATMKGLAAARGLSLSDMVRRAALGVRMPARSFDAIHAVVLARTLGELGRVGGNLNQLVRRANAGKLMGHDTELSETLTEIEALRQLLRTCYRDHPDDEDRSDGRCRSSRHAFARQVGRKRPHRNPGRRPHGAARCPGDRRRKALQL